MVKTRVGHFRCIGGRYWMLYMTGMMMSVLPSGYWTKPLPVETGRKVCRALPAELQGNTASLAEEFVRPKSHLYMQKIKLDSYTPGQHVIVSVLESSQETDHEPVNGPRTYALQAIEDDTGNLIGRFKTVTSNTQLHHCGTLTILQDDQNHARNGVVFGWLPPHGDAVKHVTVYMGKLLSG